MISLASVRHNSADTRLAARTLATGETGQRTRRAPPQLQAAARTGRLETQFTVRSVFGRPMRFASRHAGEQFIARHYRCFSGQEICPIPLPTVPDDYDKRLRALRRRRDLTQDSLARGIGGAGKSCRLSVGITQANAVPRSMATRATAGRGGATGRYERG